MSIIVSKFGGSSIADADGFRRVREIIASQKRRRYIVLSAPGKRTEDDEKITDLLVHAHRLYATGKDGGSLLAVVKERFTSIIRLLHLDVEPDRFLCSLESDVRTSPDLAASRGEYLCAKLFAVYAGLPFIDAAALIHFDKNGRIQRREIAHALCAMADRTPYAVIPGFYGSMPDGSIKTFTRGGSDITGALVASALNADVYENWTDVDGLMSIDPRICAGATCHSAVSYRQMRMLAKAGAQVLHPYCVEPVCEAGIPTILKNTFSPDKPGTYISDHVRRSVPCVCSQGGYSAVHLDDLDEKCRWIAENLSSEIYVDRRGRKIVAVRNTDLGAECVVTAFSLPSGLQDKAAQILRPLAELHSEHCSKYLLPEGAAKEAQCALHALLMNEATGTRNPSGCGEPCHSIR